MPNLRGKFIFEWHRLYPHVAIFVISFSTLACQLAQNRIFSFQYWHHVVYFVITTALLGMAAGGSIFYYSRKLQSRNIDDLLRICLSGFAMFMVACTLMLSTIDIGVGDLAYDSFGSVTRVLVAYSIIILPYIYFGMALSATFQNLRKQSGKLYFLNLTGSAAGCIAFVFLLEPFGIEVLFVLLTSICALMAAVSPTPSPEVGNALKRRRIRDCLAFLAVAAIFLLFFDPTTDSVKQFRSLVSEQNRVVETTVWHPLARVDVLSNSSHNRAKWIVYDGDAQTTMFPADLNSTIGASVASILETSKSPLRDMPYLLFPGRSPHKVAVIGSGGGGDVATALRWGTTSVDAIEINGATNRLVTGQYEPFLNRLFDRPEVRLHTDDGRAFIARNGGPYDRIVLFAIDSFAASASGAYVFSEAYLYTREAMAAFVSALEPNGVLTFGRWFYHQNDREAIRVFATGLDVLRSMGIADPGRHLLVVGSSTDRSDFAIVMISRSPIAAAEQERAIDVAGYDGYRLLFAPNNGTYEGVEDYRELAKSYKAGTEGEFYKKYPYVIEPVSDDSPFFFQYTRLSDWFETSVEENVYYEFIRSNPNAMLSILFIQTLVLVLLTVFGPAYLLKRRTGVEMGARWRLVMFFVAIGLAFMLVEISLIQKMVLYLGSPVYSFAVVVPAILGFAGIGSYLSGLAHHAARILFLAIAAIAFWVVAWQVFAVDISDLLLNSSPTTRLVLTVLLIAPLGVAMGVPFPIGIRCLCDDDRSVPILWAINSGFSVVASILVIPLAKFFGFQIVLASAVALYILGSTIAVTDRARATRSSQSV